MGVLENGTDEEIEQAKKTYRKLYSRNAQKQYRDSHVRKEIIFTKEEFLRICKAAEKHGIKPAPFLRNASLCYMDEHFILPDEKRVQKLELDLRRIGNNINQLVKYTHQHKWFSKRDLRLLQKHMQDLEDQLSHTFRQPLSLRKYLENHLLKNPKLFQMLEELTSKHSKKNDH